MWKLLAEEALIDWVEMINSSERNKRIRA